MMERTALREYLTNRAKIEVSSVDCNADMLAAIRAASEILTYDSDGAAHITINGALSAEGPDIIDILFGAGGTSYKAIISALEAASARFDEEGDVTTPIYLHVSSPGGTIDMAEATAAAVSAASAVRPVIAINEGMVASAALWIASGASEIRSSARSTWTGSVGAVLTVTKPDSTGIQVFDFVNPESPDKAPNPETPEGAEVFIDRVKAVYGIFLEDLIKGRAGKTSVEAVESLKGRVVTAQDAIKIGLIDRIIGNAVDINRTPVAITGKMDGVSDNAETGREENMKLAEYLEKHPAAKAELDALASEAREEGAAEARTAQAEMVAKLKPFMEGNAYPKRVQVACADALAGKRSVTSVLDLVALFDEIKGSNEANESDQEGEELGDTPPMSPGDLQPKAEDDGWNNSIKSLLGIG